MSTYKQRELQGEADLISLDAVRAVGDRYDPAGTAQTRAEQFAQESAVRNGFDYADAAAGNSMVVELGWLDWNSNTFSLTAPPGLAALENAVRVTTTTRNDHNFLPGSTGINAVAVAAIDEMAGIEVGSSLAGFDSSTTPFDPILEEMIGVSFSAADYDALLDASVALGDLWLDLGLGSADEVINGSVSVADAFDASIAALNSKGDPASVAAAAALAEAKGSVDAGASFTFGEIADIEAFSPNEVAAVDINVLRLVSLIASVANGSNLISATLPITIPGASSVTVQMGIIQPPQLAFGPARRDAAGEWVTTATTAQTRMMFDIHVTRNLVVLGQELDVRLPIYLEVGGADAELTGINCQIPFTASPVDVHVTTRASHGTVGEVNTGTLTGGTITVGDGVIVDDPLLLRATASSAHTIGGTEDDLSFTGPFDQPPPPGTRPTQTVGATTPSLDELWTNLEIDATAAPGTELLIDVPTVEQDLELILEPVLKALDDTLLPRLMETPLGFTFGGADVTNVSLNCHIRRLAI